MGGESQHGTRVSGCGMIGRDFGSSRGNVRVNNLEHSHGMRRLMKTQDARRGSGDLLIIENIGNGVLATGRQSGGGEIDGVFPLLIGPVEDGQDTLPAIFLEKENAGLLVF